MVILFFGVYILILGQALLDFSSDFDVALFDKVVMAFYTSSGAEVCNPTHLPSIDTHPFLATNGSTNSYSIRGKPRFMDKSANHSGKFQLSASKGRLSFLKVNAYFQLSDSTSVFKSWRN